MNKQLTPAAILLLILLLFAFTSCDKNPSVYCVNNVNDILSDTNAISGMKSVVLKNIEGTWVGLEHQLRITRDSLLQVESATKSWCIPARTYTIALEDTFAEGKNGRFDTSPGQLVFIKVQQQLWVQFNSLRKAEYDHEYYLPLTSFIKIETVQPDTIIMKMPDAKPLGQWLTTHRYPWFTTDDLKKDTKAAPVIITTPALDLPAMLLAMGKQPNLFMTPDTLVRRRRE